MTNTKTTKRALLASILSLVICLSMLASTTFAWFTDSASTAVNTIQSGKLDVTLEMLVDGKWVDAEGKTLGFVDDEGNVLTDILWEPGCSYLLQPFKITNNGNLSLKFDVVVSGFVGDAKLAEAIEYGMPLGDVNDLQFVSMGDLNDFDSLFDAVEEADLTVLDPGESFDITEDQVTFHMKEDAGNEYQDLTLSGMSITVYATQATVEFDSYTDQYDKDAAYATKEPVDYNDGKEHAIDLSEKDFIVTGADISETLAAIRVQGNSTATISGQGTVKVTAEPGVSNAMAIWARNGAQITIEDGTYILERAEGNNEEVEMIYASGAGSTITINGGTFKCNHPSKTVNIHNGSNAYIYIKGGSFWEFDPTNHEDAGKVIIPKGYTVVSEEKEDGTWYSVIPIPPVEAAVDPASNPAGAQTITGTLGETIREMSADASKPIIVELTSDLTVGSESFDSDWIEGVGYSSNKDEGLLIYVGENADVTLDLGGNTLQFDYTGANYGACFGVEDGASLTITNGTLVFNDTIVKRAYALGEGASFNIDSSVTVVGTVDEYVAD